ncbi:unnamed protein product [Candidula unifasciata]|uniref:Battenin n=1 Tax=Candidula unifasciata TaxID=100452 RepID=A0A8S3YWV5_9EUPU|nr:unnamed protein product [Candidula unifasciata]
MSFRNWVGMFLMGAVNNLPYVVVNSAASTIAESFNEKNLVGVVFAANVALSVFVKSLNTFLLLKVSYGLRIIVNGCVMLAGLFGIAYAFNFGFAIACIAVIGSTSAFGENVTLGFLLGFPGSLVNAWSSGTGMAGLLGSSLYVLFGCVVGSGQDKTNKLHSLTKYAFLLTTPVVLLYWLAYFIIIKRPSSHPDLQVVVPDLPVNYGTVGHPQNRQQQGDGDLGKVTKILNAGSINTQGYRDLSSSSKPSESACRRIVRCLRLVLWLAINLCAVYMFEYVAQACAAKVRSSKEYNVGCPELYASLQLCYQAGVFVSRSSVQLFKIRRVEILTIWQFVNMILWIVDDHYKFLPVAALPALMIVVGLLGGASYVNIFYLILHEGDFPAEDRELCVNLTGIFITTGIVLGSGFQTLLSITVLKDD